MKEIVKFLAEIEKMAGEIYRDASVFFQEDKDFAGFLGLLAEDEAYHLGIVASADEYLRNESVEIPPFLALDEIEKEEIERPFMEIRERLLSGNLTKEEMITFIVTLEFSEWNHIFLYVLSACMNTSQKYTGAVEDIQQHKKRIEDFLGSLPIGRRHLETIRALPSVSPKKILIVHDTEAIVEFLAALFKNIAIVDTAIGGEGALRKTEEHEYDVIISDVNMRDISGMEFYKRASQIHPGIGNRFLFLTGFPKPETMDFFLENNLKYIIKPGTIEELRRAVNKIMVRGSTEQLE